ncbi:MAG TPA: hypothetical protein VGJ11_09515 [Gaiellales bacterium]
MSAEAAFNEFVAAWERDEQPDPATAIASVGKADREPLAAMLAAFLSANPRRDVTEAEVDARAADPASEPPRPWAELLPELRERRRTTRGALVARLADLLGHPEARGQVGGYVHELETGLLSPTGVRPAVVAALAKILDVPASLLELSRRIVPPPADAAASLPLYRVAPPAATPPIDIEAVRQALPERNAEIDDLFTGADG